MKAIRSSAINNNSVMPTLSKWVGILSLLLLIGFGKTYASESAQSLCSVYVNSEPSAYSLLLLEEGENKVVVTCEKASNQVFWLSSISISDVKEQNNDSRINSTSFAFLVSENTPSISLIVTSDVADLVQFNISNLKDFHQSEVEHASFMSLFAGLCIALTIYVFSLGIGMNDKSLYFYPLYIMSACMFFLMQEGTLFTFIPSIESIRGFSALSILAGLTVFSGQLFLSSLLEFRSVVPKLVNNILKIFSYSMLLIPVASAFLPKHLHLTMLSSMGYLTSIILAIILYGNVRAILNNVKLSKLILCCQILLGIAMVVRLYLPESFYFIARYGLVIGLSIEAFVLAFAVSIKIKHMNRQRKVAQNEAVMDVLCPLYNRRGWFNAAKNLVEATKNEVGVHLLVYADLDKFKQINDSYGHATGDKLLIVFSKIIKTQFRQQDIIGRLGGDEFVILSSFNSEKQALSMLNRLNKRLENLRINISGNQIDISASVGFKIEAKKVANLESLMEKADKAMYEVKHSTPNLAVEVS